MRMIILIIFLSVVGCSNDDANQNPNLPDVRVENDTSTLPDLSMADAGGDTTVQQPDMPSTLLGCDGALPVFQTIQIAPENTPGQLYSQAVWDGTGAWIVYSGRADLQSPQSISVARVDCKGSIEVASTQISPTDTADRHLEPAMSHADGTTFVVWHSVDDEGDAHVWLKTLDTGVPSGEPIEITPTDNGVPISRTIWELSTVAVSANRAAVAFSFAGQNGQFVVGVQFVTPNGADGTYFVPVDDPAASQRSPTLGVDGEGGLVLSWVRTSDSIDDQAFLAKIPLGATEAVPASGNPSRPLSTPNPLAAVSRKGSDTGELFQVFQVTNGERSDILVRSASNLASTKVATFGLDQNNFRPTIATGIDGGAIAWYRYAQSPLRNSVVVGRFDGELLTATEFTISTDAAAIPPYGPSITFIEDDFYLVTWSEGASGSDSVLNAQFVQLELL